VLPSAGSMTNEIDAREALERELYWAAEAAPGSRRSTRELRMALHELAAKMRADEQSTVPRGEPQLVSRSAFRRKVKIGFYTILRPITHRYDRLIGELAVLSRTLADRLADAEAEIQRLRESGEGSDSGTAG
jgi:hypothetical protein